MATWTNKPLTYGRTEIQLLKMWKGWPEIQEDIIFTPVFKIPKSAHLILILSLANNKVAFKQGSFYS